jgi:hypothetical protein
LFAALGALGCVGTTGGQTVHFAVAAAGPADATAGLPLTFTSGDFTVTLAEAHFHIGAVYLNMAEPVSGGQATGCYLTGTYVGQETYPLDVDLLDPAPQPFPHDALGVTEPSALVEQVWLTGGDVNALTDATPILEIRGIAAGATGTVPFTGTVTISANHGPSGATGGGDSICKQRIVSPIEQPITFQSTGGLLLRIDPRNFFIGVDFGQLPADSASGGYAFSDDPTGPGYAPTGQDLYANLRSVGAYHFSWVDSF